MNRVRMDRSARVVASVAAIAVATMALAAPATAFAGLPAANPPSYNLDSTSQLIGTPKHYDFSLAASSDFIFIEMQRQATSGNKPVQQHFYGITDTSLNCESDLSSCGLSDDDALGPLGRIDLTFTPNGATQTFKSRCDDGTVYSVEKRRPGTLAGIFRIRTHTGYFGVIQNKGTTGVRVSSALPAEASKTIDKNVMCADTAAAGTVQCFSTLGITAQGGDESVLGYRTSGQSQAVLELGYKDPDSTDNVQIVHIAGANVPKKSIRETSNDPDPLEQMRLNFDALSPFASGKGRFDPTEPPETEVDDCHTIHRNGNVNGAFEANFDGWGLHEFSSLPAEASKTTEN